MGFLMNRWAILSRFVAERVSGPMAVESDPDAKETLFMLDGVGGWLFGPAMFRYALRTAGMPVHTILFDWHRGLRGDLFSDLMPLRANRLAACRLARRIMNLHRRDSHRPIHIAAYSGGCGIAVFALERLKTPNIVSTAILLAPALSPDYPLEKALNAVRRMYVGVSSRDRFLLGLGTGIFGTMDRIRTSSAGRVGFRVPFPGNGDRTVSASSSTAKLYQITWKPSWRRWGHGGGHTGWIHPDFLTAHLPALLRGSPDPMLLDDICRS